MSRFSARPIHRSRRRLLADEGQHIDACHRAKWQNRFSRHPKRNSDRLLWEVLEQRNVALNGGGAKGSL
jgi:hypothetical protein